MNYPRGSEWRKWDLHIHSPLSILSNEYPKLPNGEPDWEKYLQRLESLDIAALGITDYFSIEGYKKVLEFKESGRLKNILLLLPNIEFRLDSVISSRRDGSRPRRLNYHVIFSNEISVQDIEEHFLHDIHFYYEGNPQDRDESRKLKLSNLTSLGSKLIEEHDSFKGRSPAEVGVSCAVVDHKEITELLTSDSRFKGKYLLVLPEELSSLIDWDGQDHNIRKGLLQKSDMVFTSNPRTVKWCLGESPYTEGIDKFIEEFKTLKACIHGSDSHKLEEIGVPCIKRGETSHRCNSDLSDCEFRFCWIKADPTFEGLKQLLYEPDCRVAIQSKSPAPPRSNLTIDSIKTNKATINNELSIETTEIEFNTGLIAVAGGKGAGKTTIVDIIANCYLDRINSNDSNSFVRRIADQSPKLDIELKLKDKSIFSKDILDQSYFREGQIVYIAQGELERYIGDSSDLDQYVNNLIFNNTRIKNSVEKYEFSKTNNKIDKLEEQIQTKSKSIESLENLTTEVKAKKIKEEKKRLESEHKDVTQRIAELEQNLSQKKVRIAKDRQKVVSELKDRRDLLIKLEEKLKQAIGFLENEFLNFNECISIINKLFKNLDIAEAISDLSYRDKSNLIEKLEYIESEITKTIEEIGAVQEEIDQFEVEIRDHAIFLDRLKEIESAISQNEENSLKLKEMKTLLDKEVTDRKILFKKLINTVLELKKKYGEIIDLFSTNKATVLSDLDFIAVINFNSENLLNNAEDVVDNRRVIIRLDESSEGILASLVQFYQAVSNGKEEKVEDLVDEVERLSTELKGKIKKSSAIDIGDFYNFLYKNYLAVVPVVRYKKTNVNKLSLGQKATVLIKIYLAEGDIPIIIDSHDDHLDNEFIMDELINSIREAKKYRQVILVSNNGNVVINSDAEQIILADRNSAGRISYSSGSIEEPYIRDRAIKVLEGGPKAFKKRQHKYRL